MNYKDLKNSYLANYLIQIDEKLGQCDNPAELFGKIFGILSSRVMSLVYNEIDEEPEYKLNAVFSNTLEYCIKGTSLYLFDKFTDAINRGYGIKDFDASELYRLRSRVYSRLAKHEVENDTDVSFVLKGLDATRITIEVTVSFGCIPIWSEINSITF